MDEPTSTTTVIPLLRDHLGSADRTGAQAVRGPFDHVDDLTILRVTSNEEDACDHGGSCRWGKQASLYSTGFEQGRGHFGPASRPGVAREGASPQRLILLQMSR